MLSAILINGKNQPVMTIKQVSNFFITDRAFNYAEGQLSITLKTRRDNSKMYTVRTIMFFGDGISRQMVVRKVTTDAKGTFAKVTFDLYGIEYVLAQRNENDKEIIWSNMAPIDVCADLVGRLQNGDSKRIFSQLASTATTLGTMDKVDSWQMAGGNVMQYILDQMVAYEFCCDAILQSFNKSQLRFRVPEDRKDIIISDLSRGTKLQYVNLDYTRVCTAITAGGEGEGIRRKYATYDSGETGIDRFENFSDEASLASGSGYISNAKYYEMLNAAAKAKQVPKKQEADYIVPVSLFKKLKTGDKVYTSSSMVNNGVLEPRVISELKTSVSKGVMSRSITFVQGE